MGPPDKVRLHIIGCGALMLQTNYERGTKDSCSVGTGTPPGAPSKHRPHRGVSRRPRAVRVYQPSDPPELVGPTITMPRFR